MHKILSAVALPLAVLLLSGCGGETTANNETQSTQLTPIEFIGTPLGSSQTQDGSSTSSSFSASGVMGTSYLDDEETIVAYNNNFALHLLRTGSNTGNNIIYPVAHYAQQLAIVAVNTNDTEKQKIIALLAGGRDQEQLANLLPRFCITRLINSENYIGGFSSWVQQDFTFPPPFFDGLENIGSSIVAADFSNNPLGTNSIIKDWQFQITHNFVVDPQSTTDTRLVHTGGDAIGSNWPNYPATATQANFYGNNIFSTDYFDLQQDSSVTAKSNFLAAEIPMEMGNSLLVIMPHASCHKTTAFGDNIQAFDHPFTFFIINNPSGTITHTGIYNKPARGACDADDMNNFLTQLSVESLNGIRSELATNSQPLYLPKMSFGYLASLLGNPPPPSDAPALYYDHFNSQTIVQLNQNGITASSSSATAISLQAKSYTSGSDIKGVYVGQNMNATVGQEFGYQNFDNIDNALAELSKFALTVGSASGWPTTVFGITTTDGTGF